MNRMSEKSTRTAFLPAAFLPAAFLLAAFLLAAPSGSTMVCAQEATSIPLRWSVASSVDYSEGDYGEPVDTEIVFLSQQLAVERGTPHGNTALRLTVPWLQVKGPADIVAPGSNTADEPQAADATRSESGLGDVQLTLSQTMWDYGTRFYLVPSVGVKFPTADEDKRLGSGETDYWLRLAGMWGLSRNTTFYMSGGYRWMGRSEAYPLDDRALAGAGLYRQLGPVGLGLSYDFQQSSVASFEDQHEAGVNLSAKRGPVRTSIYGRTGFTDGSPDLNVGLRVGYTFGQ